MSDTTQKFQQEVQAREEENTNQIPTRNTQPQKVEEITEITQDTSKPDSGEKQTVKTELKSTEESSSPFTDSNKMPESTVQQTKTD